MNQKSKDIIATIVCLVMIVMPIGMAVFYIKTGRYPYGVIIFGAIFGSTICTEIGSFFKTLFSKKES